MTQGWFTIMRYRSNPMRDECRNIAVILLTDDGRGGVKQLPVLRDTPLQSILDGVRVQLDQEASRDLLQTWHEHSHDVITYTEPRPCHLIDDSVEKSVVLLYDTYVR